MKKAAVLATELQAKREELAKLFADNTVEQDGVKRYKFSPEQLTEINKRNEELGTLHDEWQAQFNLEETDRKNRDALAGIKNVSRPQFEAGPDGGSRPGAGLIKTIGQMFIESEGYKAHKGRPHGMSVEIPNFDPRFFMGTGMKTLFSTSAGWDPEFVRNGRVELTPERALVVADLPSLGSTDTDTVAWMEETTKTNNAAEAAEAAAYAESALALTERTEPISKIATFIPVTEEQMADERRVESYLDNRLERLVREKLDAQLLVGSGTPPAIEGYLNTSGIQTQAKGADAAVVAIHKAITKVRFTGYAEPDAIVLHPNDWEPIRLIQDANGNFIWGPPSEAGPTRIWGVPAVITPAITENTGLVGAFRAYSELVMRSGIQIDVSNSHDDYFVKGKLAIRAKIRCGLAKYRPSAYCSVTGL